MEAQQQVPSSGLPQELTDAIASVWKQYAGKRPSKMETQISGNVVRSVLQDAVGDFESGLLAAGEQDDPKQSRPLTRNTYRRDMIAAVGRVTGRRVMAFVSNPDAKTDVATEVFILEKAPRPQ